MADRIDIGDNVEPTLILHALGDTIGFKNGDWEFNYNLVTNFVSLDYINELIYEFIGLGGVNSIDLSEWRVSDDTIFHMAVAESMLKFDHKSKSKSTVEYISILKSELIKALKKCNTGDQNRYVGLITKQSILEFDKDKGEYNLKAGGNGCAMRNLVIGLCLHKKEQYNELVNLSIIGSKLTHNNAIGYLGGFCSAYFVSLAVQKVNILKWPFMLLEALNSDLLTDQIDKKISRETRDYISFMMQWETHIENRFDGEKLRNIKSFANPLYRIKYYYDHFFIEMSKYSRQIGDSGILGMIMAYDAVLDSGGVWEKLILYSMLHPGDSDTVGAIAGGIFGAYYGYGDVPINMHSNLEFRSEIVDLADKIKKKYFVQ